MAVKDEKSEAWQTLKTKHAGVRDIPLDDIYIDRRFQRPLSPTKLNEIAEQYHPEGIGTLCVAVVEGGDPSGSGKRYASVDGQTRTVGLIRRNQAIDSGELNDGQPKVETVRAEVYEVLTVEEAAELFKIRNNQRAVATVERDRIGLTAGDPVLKEVNRQVNMAGFTLFSDNGTAATMPHADVGKRIVRTGRKYAYMDLLAKSLQIQADAFGNERGAVDKTVLWVTADLLRKNPDTFDEEKYTDLLRKLTTPRIIAEAEVLRVQLEKRLASAAEIYLCAQYNQQIVTRIRL